MSVVGAHARTHQHKTRTVRRFTTTPEHILAGPPPLDRDRLPMPPDACRPIDAPHPARPCRHRNRDASHAAACSTPRSPDAVTVCRPHHANNVTPSSLRTGYCSALMTTSRHTRKIQAIVAARHQPGYLLRTSSPRQRHAAIAGETDTLHHEQTARSPSVRFTSQTDVAAVAARTQPQPPPLPPRLIAAVDRAAC